MHELACLCFRLISGLSCYLVESCMMLDFDVTVVVQVFAGTLHI